MITTRLRRRVSLLPCLAAFSFLALPLFAEEKTPDVLPPIRKAFETGVPQSIVVRTTENVTKGGWVWILNQCEALGINRIDLLVKQDEDNFHSERTGQTLQSGDLLVPLPGETCAPGWENADWLKEMLATAKKKNIQIWAWWPCFHDASAAKLYPKAAYTSSKGEHFVDPAVPEVRERQEILLSKLLTAYPFDGVSLDWLRYEGWYAGSKGPLGEEFARRYHFQWEPNSLENEYSKARWYEMRAKLLADWVQHLTGNLRVMHPNARWGAFLLPWQFTEASQDYSQLGRCGLDFLQPMAYWQDWKRSPEWVGETVLSRHAEFSPGVSQFPALGINAPLEEMRRAVSRIPMGAISGVSWFNYGAWEQSTFQKIRSLIKESPEARQLLGYDAIPEFDPKHYPDIPAAPSIQTIKHQPAKAKEFPADTSVWAIVCQAELYKRKALDPQSANVPVLALHTFIEGAPGSQEFLYKCTTSYLDSLLKFITQSGFNVCPLSRLQGYLITRDPAVLPPRPLIITIDDGSQSVYKYFYPRAKEQKLPFTVALVTSWLSETNKSNHATDERGTPDDTMTWDEARKMYESGLLEVISHSDAMHYQATEQPDDEDALPALVTRQYLREYDRTETNEEYARRVLLDMTTSRKKLISHGFRSPSIFCWPYGEGNKTAKEIGERAGYTHFLLFDTPPVFATPGSSTFGIQRMPVLKTDEAVPLEFPENPAEAQSWWLAFLKVGCDSCSPSLLKATLSQLTKENQHRPEAIIAWATLDYLRGDSATGTARLTALRESYPMDTAICEAVAKTLKQFNSPAQ